MKKSIFDKFSSIGEFLSHRKKKAELKAAFRRKPRPAKVRIPDDNTCPYCNSDNEAIRNTYYDMNCKSCVERM